MMKPLNQWTTADIVEFLKSIDKKTWIQIGAGALVLICFIFFIAVPTWITRFEIKAKISSIESQIRNMQTLTNRKPELMKAKENHLTYMKESKEKLFRPSETSLLLGTVSKLANECDIAIIASSPKESPEKFPAPFDTAYSSYFYDFTMEGAYHQMGLLTGKIESYPKMFRIIKFQILSNQVKGKENMHIANLTLSAVSLKEELKA